MAAFGRDGRGQGETTERHSNRRIDRPDAGACQVSRRASASPSPTYGGKQEVNIITTRFGLIQAPESEIIRIPDGLVGFRAFTQFVMIPDPVVSGLTWLQSVTAPELAFGLIAPPLAIPDYRVELRPGDRTALELDEERSALTYVILNRGEAGLTVNLQGPLVFNLTRRLGRQMVLTSSRYAVRYPLASQSPPTSIPAPTPLRATA